MNQVLCHVGSVPSDVMAHCAENSILVEAYSPVAHGALLDSPELAVMAALDALVRAGKVRALGASEMYAYQLQNLQHVADSHGWTRFTSM